MITSMDMYWLLMLDNVKVTSVMVAILGIMAIFGCICWLGNSFEYENLGQRIIAIIGSTIVLIIWLTAIVLATLIPNTKQMAVILVAPKVINNEQVQELPNQIMELANDWLKELRPNNEGVK